MYLSTLNLDCACFVYTPSILYILGVLYSKLYGFILYNSRALFNSEGIRFEYFTTMGALFNSKGMYFE